jgi:hypothetical protein
LSGCLYKSNFRWASGYIKTKVTSGRWNRAEAALINRERLVAQENSVNISGNVFSSRTSLTLVIKVKCVAEINKNKQKRRLLPALLEQKDRQRDKHLLNKIQHRNPNTYYAAGMAKTQH